MSSTSLLSGRKIRKRPAQRRLRGQQGGHRAANEGPRQRVGCLGRQRQRGCAWVHRNRQHPGTSERPGSLCPNPATHPGGPLGRRIGHHGRGALPRLERGRLCSRCRPARRWWMARAMTGRASTCPPRSAAASSRLCPGSEDSTASRPGSSAARACGAVLRSGGQRRRTSSGAITRDGSNNAPGKNRTCARG